jgi:hypothetical protein
MIRRGFWLVLGAAVGVTGYRRASRLARAIVPGRGQPGQGLAGQGLAGQGLARAWLGAAGGRGARGGRAAIGSGEPAGGAARFLRDVREGRAEYLDRHLVHRDPALEGQQIRDQPPRVKSGTGAYTGIDYAKDGR